MERQTQLTSCPTPSATPSQGSANLQIGCRAGVPARAEDCTSNDHDLIDEVATRLWNFKGDSIEDFQGHYAEWKVKHN